MNISDYALTAIAVYNIVMVFILNTKNWQSAVLFKVIPFINALYLMYVVFVP
jgi:hypothetical protein